MFRRVFTKIFIKQICFGKISKCGSWIRKQLPGPSFFQAQLSVSFSGSRFCLRAPAEIFFFDVAFTVISFLPVVAVPSPIFCLSNRHDYFPIRKALSLFGFLPAGLFFGFINDIISINNFSLFEMKCFDESDKQNMA